MNLNCSRKLCERIAEWKVEESLYCYHHIKLMLKDSETKKLELERI